MIIKEWFVWLVQFIFGCTHDKITRPFSNEDGTYVICMQCTKVIQVVDLRGKTR